MKLILPILAATVAWAADSRATADRARDILATNCVGCHSAAAKMSGLDLSTREAALKGGAKGPSIQPGNAAESRLWKAVSRAAGEVPMPPGKPLDAQSVAALREWIDQGALWPDSAPGAAQPAWWSFQKIVKPPVPRSESTWARNDIDRFLEAGFRKQALKPATEAGRAALIRRLSYGLHGLPATADEAAAFEKDTASDAYEKLVDRLLASPRYGEKAGRFWLDLARYSDTAGFELDTYIADAWRYRDYVIQSFNDDKPYNRFIREQIAGDEMFRDDPAAQTGTGYFCVGPNRDGFPDQADINRVEVLTDFVDTTSSVFLGLSAGCARCHDHKYDPIPQRDYFRMQAIFAPFVKTRVPLNRLNSLFWDVSENIREIKLREIGEELTAIQSPCRNKLYQARLAAIPADAARAIQTEDAKRTPEQEVLTRKYESEVRVSNDEIRGCLSPEKAAELHAIEKRLVAMFSGYRSKPFACGVTDMSDVSPRTYMPVRGAAKGTEVFPGFFSALGGGDVSLEPPELPTSTGPIPYQPTTGRRKALAEWLTKPDHPLTPRVIVNRIWQFHFGKGIVATPNDFGRRGAPPSNPELLDWLASEFVSNGWSMKKLHRSILMSAAYRQAAEGAPESRAKDPENVYLSRFGRRRLGAEELRDSVLRVADALNTKMGGRPVVPPLTREEMFGMIGKKEDAWIETADPSEHSRRSVYLIQKRAFRSPMLEVFDQPESMLTCPRRESSTTAPQSLTLLNGQFAVDRARELGNRLAQRNASDESLIRAAWRAVLARDPSADESGMAARFVRDQSANAGNRAAAAVELIRGLFNTNEFLYVE